ncbi:MAG: universal stress protein [Sulfobacillus sp.]|nr:universal stress protein [Sulfobacillus sp.]
MGFHVSGELGQLKIFLGMAPGVGKTYTMLREARLLKARGVDVVVGYVDTHERPDTARQLDGLEVVERLAVEWQGRVFEEVNLEAILARRPDVVVIDELAHSNVPGSRFPKRYMDVEFLLDHGIDVLTAVNVQHLEPVQSEAEAITKVPVREVIPATFLARAQEIEVIDVTPETLRQRLLDGGIYPPEKVDQALKHFFRAENLAALRELMLRRVAEDVDERLQHSFERRLIPGPVGARETIMVCVSYLERSRPLLERAKRMADRMKADLIMLTVTDEEVELLDQRERRHVDQLEDLARQYRAKFIAEPRRDRRLGEVILQVAERENVTQIVIGQPHERGWRSWVKDSPVPFLLKNLRYVDLRIVGWRDQHAQ